MRGLAVVAATDVTIIADRFFTENHIKQRWMTDDLASGFIVPQTLVDAFHECFAILVKFFILAWAAQNF